MRNDENKALRLVGLDVLKILAALFVIVLHVDGYYLQFVGEINSKCLLGYNILETISYPAIHIFVLCGSYLMQNKENKLHNYLAIYFQMYFVTVVGLVLIMLFQKDKLSCLDIVICLFPFSLRAYGYVSSWIILMLLSTFLNNFTRKLSNTEYIILLVVVAIPVSIMPTLFYGVWQNDYMGLFILLYLVAGFFYRNQRFFSMKNGMSLWVMCYILTFMSSYILKKCNAFSVITRGDHYYLYQYNSILIIGMAVGLFLSIGNCNIKIPSVFQKVCSVTLFIYLYHMHPVIKKYYVNILGGVNCVNSNHCISYIISVMGISICVFVIGVFFGIPYTKIIKLISVFFEKKMNSYHFISRKEKYK